MQISHEYYLKDFYAATLLKKETLAEGFSCEFCEIFKNIIFIAYLRETVFGRTYTGQIKALVNYNAHVNIN